MSTEIKYPPGTEFDESGYPRYWSKRYGCWMYPVLWDRATGKPIYSLMPKQWETLKLTPLLRPQGASGPIHIGFGGAAGGGKSFFARAVAAVAAHVWPGSTTVIIRQTEGDVKKNHVVPFQREVPRGLYDLNSSDLTVTWHNGSVLHFQYLEHDKHLSRFQGPAYDIVIPEERTLIDSKLLAWVLGNRLRSSVPGTTPFSLSPSNPGGQGHHEFRRLFIECRYDPERDEQADDYAFVQAKLDDNYVLKKDDPVYGRKLNTLPEPYRSWMRDGDFHAGAGRAIPQLYRAVHLVPFFIPPPHWLLFGGFDWGFEHPFSFGYYAVNEDGRVFKVDTITGRHLNPPEIADRVIETLKSRGLSHERLQYVAAGHDCWAERKAHGETLPTIAQRMQERGFPLVRANIGRIMGLNNLREYLAWEGRGPNGSNAQPAFVFMDTPGNRKSIDCMENAVPDPNNLEDVLKTDADAFGEGGDDTLEETRYALASRPARAKSLLLDEPVRAWSEAALAHEYEQGHRVRSGPPARIIVLDPMFGDLGIDLNDRSLN